MKNRKRGTILLRRDNIDARIETLDRRKEKLKTLIAEEGKPGGVFHRFKRLSPALLEVLADIEPLDDLMTASEDRLRTGILDELVRVMEQHMRLQNCIVRSQRKRA